MIEYGGGISCKEYGAQTMRCSNCGKHLGNRGWEKDREYNEVEDKGWNFYPYCGEKLKSNGNKDE